MSSVNRKFDDFSSVDETGPIPGFGERVKAARKRLDLTQEELGDRIGRAGSALSDWEKDKRPPEGGHVLVRLASTLGVSVDYLLTGREAPGVAAVVKDVEALLDRLRRIELGGGGVGEMTGPAVPARQKPDDGRGEGAG